MIYNHSETKGKELHYKMNVGMEFNLCKEKMRKLPKVLVGRKNENQNKKEKFYIR